MSSADIQKSATSITFYKYIAFTYFILLWSKMTEMTCFRATVIASCERCVNMVFSADNKVYIKSLYQFSGGSVQTFN